MTFLTNEISNNSFDYKIIPDKVTTSLTLRPTLSNLEMIVSSVSNGEGIALFASVLFETNPSLRPSWTYQKGPPLYKMWSQLIKLNTNLENNLLIKRKICFNICMSYEYLIIKLEHTRWTESLATMANISAQDTTPLHELSTELLILSMTSNPLAEFLFGVANFSISSSPSSRIEPSQPWEPKMLDKQKGKKESTT